MSRRSWTGSVVAAVGAGLLVLGASTVLTHATLSTARPAPTPAAARAALDRLVRQGLLAPGRRATGSDTRAGGLNQVSYYNWSGYADDNSTGKTYTKVAGTWTQPKVTCPTNEDAVAVFWVGLDGFNNSTVEQAGTMAQCYLGSTFYYTWWEMYPTNYITTVGSTVAPGDHITASVNFARGTYTMAVTDSTTTANSFSMKQACGTGLTCANSSAEWIAETPSYSRGYTPWPAFGTWKVTGAKVTGAGTAGVISTFPDDQITIIGSFGENLANTGTLNTAGNGFGDTWAYTW